MFSAVSGAISGVVLLASGPIGRINKALKIKKSKSGGHWIPLGRGRLENKGRLETI